MVKKKFQTHFHKRINDRPSIDDRFLFCLFSFWCINLHIVFVCHSNNGANKLVFYAIFTTKHNSTQSHMADIDFLCSTNDNAQHVDTFQLIEKCLANECHHRPFYSIRALCLLSGIKHFRIFRSLFFSSSWFFFHPHFHVSHLSVFDSSKHFCIINSFWIETIYWFKCRIFG